MSGRVKRVVERMGGAGRVAHLMGVHETTVYAWMRNDSVAWRHLIDFCRHCGVAWTWLAGWQLDAPRRARFVEAVRVPWVPPAELPPWCSGRVVHDSTVRGLIVDGRLAQPGDWIVLMGTDQDGRADVRIIGSSDWPLAGPGDGDE